MVNNANHFNSWFNTEIFNHTTSQPLASNVRTLSSRFSGVRITEVHLGLKATF